MDRLRLALVALLLPTALACGSKSDAAPPRIKAFSATLAWTPSMELNLEIEVPGADLSAVYYAWVRPDGSVVGREALLLGAALGDTLGGQATVSATRVVGIGEFLPPSRVRLRVFDAARHEAVAHATLLRPTFGASGDACSGSGQPCAGELACQAGRCAVPATTTAACASAPEPTWRSGVAELSVPAGAADHFSGTCGPVGAHGDAVYTLVLDAAGGEHLELEVPPTAVALLRADCEAPASQVLCLTASAGLDLPAGRYVLIVDAISGVAASSLVRLTRTPL
jgi:hypothetical protein